MAVIELIYSNKPNTGLNQGFRLANERQRYFVMTSLIGWVEA